MTPSPQINPYVLKHEEEPRLEALGVLFGTFYWKRGLEAPRCATSRLTLWLTSSGH